MGNKKIAVIGGGISGLTAAYRLLQKGFEVKLFESLDKLGGLARSLEVEGCPVEIFYHHFFSTDNYFFGLCRETGVNDKVRWLNAKMGYLSDGGLFDFGTPASLLKFQPLSLSDKINFGLSVLKIKNQKSLEKMDRYTAEDWLIKNAGKNVFNVVWKPLLIQKFGDAYKDISMAWLWKKIQIRSLAKKNIFAGESLAYLDGSLEVLINKLNERIVSMNGQIALKQKVDEIKAENDEYEVRVSGSAERFHAVVSTVSAPILNSLLSAPDEFNFARFKQIGLICILLVLNRKLTGYYWLNIADVSFPFGLVVEHTNFCNKSRYNGKHIIYLSKYLKREDRIYSELSDKEIKDYFLKHLARINPDFKEDWIEKLYIFREPFAQPIIARDYLRIKPTFSSHLRGFYWLSANHIFPEDRGINYSIKMAEEVADLIYNELNSNP